MGLFSFFGNNTLESGDLGAGESIYSNDEMLGVYKDLSYIECRDIYRYWALGKRIASALPNFAMSAKRVFTCPNHPIEIVNDFEKICEQYNIDNLIKQTSIYARVYGVACLYLAIDGDNDNLNEPLSYKTINEKNFSFNALDPLSMGGGVVLDNNPLSTSFQKPLYSTIQGNTIASNRMAVVANDIPLYLKFNPSSFSFSGASVYQNMTLLIRSWNRCIIAMQRLATKGGALVKVSKEVSQASGINMMAVKRNLELVRNIENDGICSIQNGETISGFEMTGLNEIDKMIQDLNSALMMALADTPSGILLDRNLADGFGEGKEDMKAILMAVDSFRNSLLLPMYRFVDKILLYKMLTPNYLRELRDNNEQYKNMTEADIFMDIKQSFKADFGELYPLNGRDLAEAKRSETDYLKSLQDLGVKKKNLESIINESPLFNVNVELEGEGEDE